MQDEMIEKSINELSLGQPRWYASTAERTNPFTADPVLCHIGLTHHF